MKGFLILALTLAAVAIISGFVHHDHSKGHDHEVDGEESSTSSSGEKHHHHHGKHHHKKHHHHHHKHHHHWKCNGEAVNSNAELIKAKKECHTEFKEAKENNVENRQKGRTCKSLCAGKKIGFFDEEGQVVQTKVDELIESMIESTEAQADIKEKAVACATNTTEVFADGPSDTKCSNYKPYLKCLWMSTMEVCVKNFDPEDWE
ncbi:transcription factor MafAa [Folsomia candida]|uniref:Uncharacterized protein n=1 Tax=Folsomia candida TaxID=158441 RepID=A0A226EMT9_FOLCA|nr:transcription factor MafAa [Folsomia candida]OXA58498.1 hypothetical protein Fcan01_08393 [Folsomia candida]